MIKGAENMNKEELWKRYKRNENGWEKMEKIGKIN